MAKKVRVIKSNEPARWYADYIGEVFEVIDEFGADYRVKHGDGVEFIEKADCSVFAEEKEERVSDAVNPLSELYPKYYKNVEGIAEIDVYKVHELFEIDDPSGAIHHASKKLLLSGSRTGGKSKYEDVKEARDTLTRWLDMNK